ncbi:MAG: competence protein CoiA family protein [Turicibacter sp.]|nr:competence protein CoiA family protein [Turicibacter sp.]
MKIAKYNNELIDLTKVSREKVVELKQLSNYSCPYCEEPVILKQGPKRTAHFSHLTCCTYEGHETESIEHQQAKTILSGWLLTQGATNIQLEFRIPQINRIADIYFEYNEKKYVFEIQKSIISQTLFDERNLDYGSLDINVLWIFIGEVQFRSKTVLVNQMMRRQKEQRLIHFSVITETITFLDQLVWLNQKEVESNVRRYPLKLLSLNQLILPEKQYKEKKLNDWLVIKKEFRLKKYASYQRSERLLLRLCAPYLINFSLLPSVVGWPIEGRGYDKPLFIWQAYVVLCIMSSYEEQEVFTLSDLRQKLRFHYHLKETSEGMLVLKKYLTLLAFFGMLKEEFGYYEYIKRPRLYSQLEPYLIEDKQLGERWLTKKTSFD